MRTTLGYSIGLILLFIFIYTRFINISWGLPYPFHPDERNMAVALQQLHCSLPIYGDSFNLKECFNPHFFAYGQFQLYMGYIIISLYHIVIMPLNSPLFGKVTFTEATIVLRLISVFASATTILLGISIVQLLQKKHEKITFSSISLALIFSPGLIQMAHFGTTESLLTCFYTALIYFTLRVMKMPSFISKYVYLVAFICGMAVATKISAILFFGLPTFYFISQLKTEHITEVFFRVVLFSVIASFTGIILSPFNIIDLPNFLSSMNYESAVALGQVDVFYTKQFANTIPVIYQFVKIFPYALGLPVVVGFIAGLFLLPYSKQMNLLRFSFLLYFLPTAFMYTKWSRFMAPVFPVMIIISVLFLLRAYQFIEEMTPKSRIALPVLHMGVLGLFCINGIAFLSIYTQYDTRFQVSDWIYQNLSPGTQMLGETANVVDLPITTPRNPNPKVGYRAIPFNFYDLDKDSALQNDLISLKENSEYILIPSRRVFKDYTCVSADSGAMQKRTQLSGYQTNTCELLNQSYPQLSLYYQQLFSGSLGFITLKKFTSYPTLKVFGHLLTFPDEEAEETWTVFDHPVIRIYKRLSSVHSVSS